MFYPWFSLFLCIFYIKFHPVLWLQLFLLCKSQILLPIFTFPIGSGSTIQMSAPALDIVLMMPLSQSYTSKNELITFNLSKSIFLLVHLCIYSLLYLLNAFFLSGPFASVCS